jgi:hypothetical protein
VCHRWRHRRHQCAAFNHGTGERECIAESRSIRQLLAAGDCVATHIPLCDYLEVNAYGESHRRGSWWLAFVIVTCARRHPHRRNVRESHRSLVLRSLAAWKVAAGSVDRTSRQIATSRGSDLAVKRLGRGPFRDAAPCPSARPRSEWLQSGVPSPSWLSEREPIRTMSVIGSAPSDAGQLNQTESAAGMSALRVGHNRQARDDHQGCKHHVVVALHAVRSPVAREGGQRGVIIVRGYRRAVVVDRYARRLLLFLPTIDCTIHSRRK